MLAKVSHVIFGIVSAYFMFMNHILLLMNFYRTIRAAYVYFIIYA
jgi:membrane associated rhomboid family serine protease